MKVAFIVHLGQKINSVFGEGSTNYSTIFFWFAKFPFGDFSLENELREGPLPKVNNDELKAILESNISQTTHELASKYGVSILTRVDHLSQINKVKKLDRWVPHELNVHQMEKQSDACVSLLSWNKG